MNVEFKARGSRGEIWLYDQVGASFWGDGVTAKSFQKELTALGKVTTINLHINSPGGDVFDGLAIYNQLKQHPAQIIVDVDGLAASIASIIAMAGDEIRIAKNAMMMIHDPQGGAFGTADDMMRTAALLNQVKGNLADTYVARTNNKRDVVDNWMSEETWLTADAAVEHGFADAVTAETAFTACFDLSKFKNTPDALRKQVVASRPSRELTAMRVADAGRRVAAICKP